MKSVPLGARDRDLLRVLVREGRITNQALAERIHLSPSACLERWKRLEQAGYITAYRAELALAKLGVWLLVNVEVTLNRHEAGDFACFERAILAIPQIFRCDAIGGGIDYLLTVAARDMADYQALIERLLAADIGIGRYFTYVVTKAVKDDPIGLMIQLLAVPNDLRLGP